MHTVFTAPGATFPFGAHVAVAEVDTETGQAVLRRLIAVDDAGTVLNPLLAEGQRHGGIAQGAAQALLEEVVYDADGNPLTASFADYPFLVGRPRCRASSWSTWPRRPTYNPLGVKGIGEAGSIGATPAVQNAVIDAVAHLGVRHIDMPTSPRTVWRAVAMRATAKGAADEGRDHRQRREPGGRGRAAAAAGPLPARGVRAAGGERRLRHHLVRCLHGAAGRRPR